MKKIRQLEPRLQTTNRARRNIVYELTNHRHDQIVFAARRTSDGLWYVHKDAAHDAMFYICEIIAAQTRAEILVKHLNRAEGGDDGA